MPVQFFGRARDFRVWVPFGEGAEFFEAEEFSEFVHLCFLGVNMGFWELARAGDGVGREGDDADRTTSPVSRLGIRCM